MSMILTAYNAIKPLPPEGSEEWLAMLPGWSGWIYDDYYCSWHDGREGCYALDFYYDYSPTCYESGLVCPDDFNYLANGLPYYHSKRGCYIFRGGPDPANEGYYLAWATSLTPQR